MNLNEYQARAIKFAKFKNNDYPFLALSEEAGEISGKLAKYVRKQQCSLSTAIYEATNGCGNDAIQLREDLKKELGDLLWQVSACCYELGLSLSDAAYFNLDKLSDRDERGVIVGEGDNR